MPDVAASQALFSAILSIAADAIITVDEEQRVLQFNEGAERIFGYTEREIVGQPLELLLPTRFHGPHRRHVNEFGAGHEAARQMGHRREIYGRRKDGTEFPAEASIAQLQLPSGHRVFSAVLRDVTERKRAEQGQDFMLATSTALASTLDFETIVASVPALAARALGDWCALDVLDTNGAMRHVDASVDAESTLSRALRELYPLDADSPWPAQDVLRTGRAISAVTDTEWLEAHTLDGVALERLRESGLDSVVLIPLRARERVLGVLTLARSGSGRRFDAADVTLATEFASRAALAIDNAQLYGSAHRATRARDEVLGVVSHDLRNPLSAIAMCASALRAGSVDGETSMSLAGTIAESAEWMQRLIRDLLDVAALESGRLTLERRAEPVGDLLDRTTELFSSAAAERGITLQVAPAPQTDVFGDFERLLQVLANLVGNALKFTDRGGSVTISATDRTSDVLFQVTDSGAGIPHEHFAHLFELYWHTQHEGRARGSGYGLSIAKGIVVAHGGQIEVESRVGEGSTFCFSVPCLPRTRSG